MNNKYQDVIKYTIFFGVGGAGKVYSEHTKILPKYYLDNY